MPTVKVLNQDATGAVPLHEIEAAVVDGRVLTDAGGVAEALGWELKPEGLCRGDVCVPVRPDAAVRNGDRIDLGAVASVLGMASMVDEQAAVVAVSAPAADRRAALKGRVAPGFSLPDLDGKLRSLEEFKDRKRLLIAFASW
ncbi:MAG: hypothetical protein R2707_14865 [Acidimicrobiales bacterium]